MAVIVFENLFLDQQIKIRESYANCRFLMIQNRKDQKTEKYYKFFDEENLKVIFLENKYLSKKEFFKNLPDERVIYFLNPIWKKEQIIYLPYRFKKMISKIKNLGQFNSFMNYKNARFCIVEGNLRENKINFNFCKIFLFWLLCISVAFFWEINGEGDNFK